MHTVTGTIYFLHLATGFKQECVPPGFADNLTSSMVQSGQYYDTNASEQKGDSSSVQGSVQSVFAFDPLAPISSSDPQSIANPNPISHSSNYFPPLSAPNSETKVNNNSDSNSNEPAMEDCEL